MLDITSAAKVLVEFPLLTTIFKETEQMTENAPGWQMKNWNSCFFCTLSPVMSALGERDLDLAHFSKLKSGCENSTDL